MGCGFSKTHGSTHKEKQRKKRFGFKKLIDKQTEQQDEEEKESEEKSMINNQNNNEVFNNTDLDNQIWINKKEERIEEEIVTQPTTQNLKSQQSSEKEEPPKNEMSNKIKKVESNMKIVETVLVSTVKDSTEIQPQPESEYRFRENRSRLDKLPKTGFTDQMKQLLPNRQSRTRCISFGEDMIEKVQIVKDINKNKMSPSLSVLRRALSKLKHKSTTTNLSFKSKSTTNFSNVQPKPPMESPKITTNLSLKNSLDSKQQQQQQPQTAPVKDPQQQQSGTCQDSNKQIMKL